LRSCNLQGCLNRGKLGEVVRSAQKKLKKESRGKGRAVNYEMKLCRQVASWVSR
jgi:hypothetical protein